MCLSRRPSRILFTLAQMTGFGVPFPFTLMISAFQSSQLVHFCENMQGDVICNELPRERRSRLEVSYVRSAAVVTRDCANVFSGVLVKASHFDR